jgi:hypothetical protein
LVASTPGDERALCDADRFPKARGNFEGSRSKRPSRHSQNVMGVQRKIATYLRRSEPVPAALAKNLADLLWKEQRQRLGQLGNMRRRGELR